MSKRYPFNGYESMASGYTNGLYLPTKPLDEWNVDECRKALCRQANGDVMRCLECESPCRYGKRIAVLLAPPEKEGEKANEKATDAKRKRVEAMTATRKRNSEIKFLQMIASGNPKAYLEAHGMEVRNNLGRVKKLYKDVTPEEARKRLADMGAEVEEVFDKLPESKPEPVKNEDVKLRIHSLSGKYGLYTRKGNAICIDPTPAYVATAEDVDAICAEIKAVFEMMA